MNIKEWIQGVLSATFFLEDAAEKCPVKVITCDHLPKIKFSKDMLKKKKKPKSRKQRRIVKKLKKAA
jgi:hypothetical protein